MLVSKRQGFVFIHVFKAAGTSIRAALAPYAKPALTDRVRERLGRRRFPAHMTAQQARDRLGSDTYDRLFSFSFVRNPWDWQVSLWTYMLAEPSHWAHPIMRELGTFDRYIRWRVDVMPDTQSAFVTDDTGRVMVDFVGRYEHLNRDFGEVCARIGVQAALPHLNASRSSRDYREWYTPETRDLIGEAFADDIDRFGYAF